MLNEVLFALWFFLPAGIANMAPVPIAKLPGLKRLDAPLDLGATFRGKRLLGSHKTWRGLIAGIIAAVLVVWLQQYFVREYGWFSVSATRIDYATIPAILLGTMFALGALGGDAVESFFKRQRGIRSGGVWFPFDVIDHILGAILLAAPLVLFDWYVYLAVIAIWMVLNILVSYVGYFIKIKERPL